MTQHGLLIDYEFCTGCHACEMACKVEKGLGEGEWGIKLAQIGPWKLDGDAWEWDYVLRPVRGARGGGQGAGLRAPLPVAGDGVRPGGRACQEGDEAAHGAVHGSVGDHAPAAHRKGAPRGPAYGKGGFA